MSGCLRDLVRLKAIQLSIYISFQNEVGFHLCVCGWMWEIHLLYRDHEKFANVPLHGTVAVVWATRLSCQ